MLQISIEANTLGWLRKQNVAVKNQIGFALHKLQTDPDDSNTKILEAVKYQQELIRSLRVGSYRVAYQIRDGSLVVLVIHIGDRKAVYDELKRKIRKHLRFEEPK